MNFDKILCNLFSILITNTFFISLFKIINKLFYILNYFNLFKSNYNISFIYKFNVSGQRQMYALSSIYA